MAVAIPLMFCSQTDAVVRKRKVQNIFINGAGLLMTCFLITDMILQLTYKGSLWAFELIWNFSTVLLTIVLGLALLRIWRVSKELKTEGIFCNQKLMLLHYGSFVTLAILSIITFALTDHDV